MALMTVLIFALFMGLPGCAGTEDPGDFTEEVDELMQQIVELETHMKTLEAENLFLQDQITWYQAVLPHIMTDHPDRMIVEQADLDGNGREETVQLNLYQDHPLYLLEINGMTRMGLGENIDQVIHFTDLDTNDVYLEVGISESGPSDDYFTSFYRWTGESFYLMGKVGARPGEGIVIHGNGTLTARTRGQVLHTWFYDKTYRINQFGHLSPVPTEYYPMNTTVTLRVDLDITETPGGQTLTTVFSGETLLIMATDDQHVLQVKTSDGEIGYLELDGFDRIRGTDYTGRDVFDGLNYAD